MSLNGNATATERLQGRIKNIDVIYKDAYRIAVENGFEGTITEWLASLKGEKGDPAPKTPNPDWNQENPDSADYILNKPDIGGMIADQIDDANQYTDKTWSSSRIYGTIIENRSFANNYTDNKVAGIIDDTVVAKYKTWSSGKIAPMIVDCYEYAAEQANGIIDDAAVSDKAWSSKNTVDKLCPGFGERGSVVVCEPVGGCPLNVSTTLPTSTGVSKITLYHEGIDEEDSREYTVDFGETYFDGYYDWEAGELHTKEEGTMQFKPQVITAFSGRNSFRSDCGDTYVGGAAAPNKYWAKKLAEQKVDDTKVGTAPWSSKNTVDKLCPSFEESGGVAVCEPVEGYPLEVISTIEPKEDGSNWESIKLYHRGKNLINQADLIYDRELLNSSGAIGASEGWYVTKWVPVLPSTKYTISGTSSLFRAEVDENLNRVSTTNFEAQRTFTTTEKTRYARFNSKTAGYETPQLEFGNTVTPYEEYRNGGQWTVDFANLEADGDLLFGSYNWTTGVLDTGEHGLFQHDPETNTFTYIDNLDYVPPIVRNMPAMPGTNAFYSDCGDTTVNGKSDPVKIIEKLTNAILALGGNV